MKIFTRKSTVNQKCIGRHQSACFKSNCLACQLKLKPIVDSSRQEVNQLDWLLNNYKVIFVTWVFGVPEMGRF